MRELKVMEHIGLDHRKWLVDLWKRFEIHQEPIIDVDRKVLAEPLFWFTKDGLVVACFGTDAHVSRGNGYQHVVTLSIGEDVS